MREHWRLGEVERRVLEALAEADAHPDRPHRKCAQIVRRLSDDHGVSPRYGYDAISTLAKPWLLHLPLVDFHGNNGSPDATDRPANPRYTEARLSPVGAMILASELGTGPRLPIALINGNFHADGMAPPFSPARVIGALAAVVDDPRITDDEIVARIGLPESPTGCAIECDVTALARGDATEVHMAARCTVETGPRGRQLVVTHLPLGVGSTTVSQALADRANVASRRRELGLVPDEFAALRLELRDLHDETRGWVARIVCEPRPGADLAELEQQIAATWGVHLRHAGQLPAPLPDLVRELVDDDRAAQRAALATLAGLR